MNIKELHAQDKPVSAISMFKNEMGNVSTLQILKGEMIKEHVTKTPALLICVTGEAIFENEEGIKETLMPGDYVNIEPMILHWVNGIADSYLLLIK